MQISLWRTTKTKRECRKSHKTHPIVGRHDVLLVASHVHFTVVAQKSNPVQNRRSVIVPVTVEVSRVTRNTYFSAAKAHVHR